jgi:hypothetical protein
MSRTGSIVAILKAAHDVHDGVHLADVTEEFVPEPLALARAFHEAGDVHELNGRRDQLHRAGDLRQNCQAFIGHDDHALIRLDGAKRIIRRLRLPCACDRIEEGGFANIGETDDTSSEHKGAQGSAEHGGRIWYLVRT